MMEVDRVVNGRRENNGEIYMPLHLQDSLSMIPSTSSR